MSELDFVAILPVYLTPFAYEVNGESIAFPLARVASEVSTNSALPVDPDNGIVTFGTSWYTMLFMTTFFAISKNLLKIMIQ
jgi:hypothetical protein